MDNIIRKFKIMSPHEWNNSGVGVFAVVRGGPGVLSYTHVYNVNGVVRVSNL